MPSSAAAASPIVSSDILGPLAHHKADLVRLPGGAQARLIVRTATDALIRRADGCAAWLPNELVEPSQREITAAACRRLRERDRELRRPGAAA